MQGVRESAPCEYIKDMLLTQSSEKTATSGTEMQRGPRKNTGPETSEFLDGVEGRTCRYTAANAILTIINI